jgi:hypothetical protein
MGIGPRRLLGILGLWVMGPPKFRRARSRIDNDGLVLLPYDGRLAMSVSPDLYLI